MDQRITLASDEVLEQLTDYDIQKLRMIARSYAKFIPDLEETDLLQDALEKVLDGSRTCPSNVDVLLFFKGVLKSLADNHLKKKMRREALENDSGELNDNVADLSQLTPEETLLEKEREREFETFLLNACKNREKDVEVVKGIMYYSLRGKDLCEHAGIGMNELPTVLKRLRRMFAKYEND